MLRIILVLIAAGLLWVTYSTIASRDEAASTALVKSVEPDRSPARNAEAAARWAEQDKLERIRNVKLTKESWRKGGFDNVLIGSFTIENANDFDVKDVAIECEQLAPSGTVVGRASATVYRTVKSKASASVKDFNMGLMHSQASRASCKVAGFP